MMKRKCNFGFSACKRLRFDVNVLDLPSNVLTAILKYLSSTQRRTVTRVCKPFFNFCAENFPQDNRLVLSEESDFSYNGSLYQTFSKDRNKRLYRRLLIKSLPANTAAFEDFCRLLKILGPALEDLQITEMASYDGVAPHWCNYLYSLMPNLRNLEVCDEDLLGDLSYLANCQAIRVNGVMRDLQKLHEIRKMKHITMFTCSAIELKSDFPSELVPFLAIKVKKLLKTLLWHEENALLVQVKSHFNFNNATRNKLSLESVTELKFKNGINSLKISKIDQFPNLTGLTILSLELPQRKTLTLEFDRIKKLELSLRKGHPFEENIDMFTKFPDVASLKLSNFSLTDDHFKSICTHMPNIEELVLLDGPNGTNEISTKAISEFIGMLEELTKLTIESTFDFDALRYPLPYLPKLRELVLKGDDWLADDDEEWINIGLWKQLHKLKIDKIDLQQWDSELMSFAETNFTHLHLPGEGKTFILDEIPNAALADGISQHCVTLQELTIEDNIGFTFEQEMKMFACLPDLRKITCIIETQDYIYNRVMTRDAYTNPKGYLLENIQFYPNLIHSVTYILEQLMPPYARGYWSRIFEEMYRERLDEFPDVTDEEDFKRVYMATQYLGMKAIHYCRLVCLTERSHDVD